MIGVLLVGPEIVKEDAAIFVKPETFMNQSGTAVSTLVQRFEILSEEVVVIHDDIDLPFGNIKIVFQSGAGGHNGVRSVADALGTHAFVRIKIGIAPTNSEGRAMRPKAGIFQSQKSAVSRYVLKDFSQADMEKIHTLTPRVKSIIETILSAGREKAMNMFN